MHKLYLNNVKSYFYNWKLYWLLLNILNSALFSYKIDESIKAEHSNENANVNEYGPCGNHKFY